MDRTADRIAAHRRLATLTWTEVAASAAASVLVSGQGGNAAPRAAAVEAWSG